ncbi:hypothetical protein KI387_010555, partial [Taxus chinensis]
SINREEEVLMSHALNKSCQKSQIGTVKVQVKEKCLDLPFKLFGTTIPVSHDPPESANVSDRETNDSSTRPREDGQGVSFENSDGESQEKKAKESVEETDTSESANGKRSSSGSSDKVMPKKPDKLLPCPRCDSLDTKFCYYNNYNVNQPRHFCKNCQRYWTAGGTLRNVPVGAGRRKSKHNPNNNNTTTALINSHHGSLHSMASCFSLPLPIQNELSSSVISFGLEHDTPAFSTNGTQVLSPARRASKLVGHMDMHGFKGSWWMNNIKTGTTGCTSTNSTSPWPSCIENISVWSSSATFLGKHPRSNHQPEAPIMVPTPLRTYDSIWENLKNETKAESSKSTGIFKEFNSQSNERADGKQVCSSSFRVQSINTKPAPHSR